MSNLQLTPQQQLFTTILAQQQQMLDFMMKDSGNAPAPAPALAPAPAPAPAAAPATDPQRKPVQTKHGDMNHSSSDVASAPATDLLLQKKPVQTKQRNEVASAPDQPKGGKAKETTAVASEKPLTESVLPDGSRSSSNRDEVVINELCGLFHNAINSSPSASAPSPSRPLSALARSPTNPTARELLAPWQQRVRRPSSTGAPTIEAQRCPPG